MGNAIIYLKYIGFICGPEGELGFHHGKGGAVAIMAAAPPLRRRLVAVLALRRLSGA